MAEFGVSQCARPRRLRVRSMMSVVDVPFTVVGLTRCVCCLLRAAGHRISPGRDHPPRTRPARRPRPDLARRLRHDRADRPRDPTPAGHGHRTANTTDPRHRVPAGLVNLAPTPPSPSPSAPLPRTPRTHTMTTCISPRSPTAVGGSTLGYRRLFPDCRDRGRLGPVPGPRLRRPVSAHHAGHARPHLARRGRRDRPESPGSGLIPVTLGGVKRLLPRLITWAPRRVVTWAWSLGYLARSAE